MGDISLIQSCYSTLSHIIVLSVDYVERSTCIDHGLYDLLCFLCVPLSGLLCYQIESVVCCCVIQSTGTSLLCCGTHNTL